MKKNLKADSARGGGTYKHRATIMLTGTIDCLSFNRDTTKPKINVVFDQTLERLAQYENAITRYIEESYFTDIVFVENSGYPFPTEKYTKLAGEYGKRFEFLYLKLSDENVAVMQEKGKSWGEANLIDYAMRNSKLIAETDVVYKCTGRIYLRNSKRLIHDGTKHTKSQFIKTIKVNRVVTWFFKIKKEDYFKYLSNTADLMNDHDVNNDKLIEDVWFNILKYEDIEVDVFCEYPRVIGMRASAGKAYERPFYQYVLADLSIKFGMKAFRVK